MNFYEVGYSSERITNTSKKHMMKSVKFLRKTSSLKVLHVGCGEGYYFRQAIDEGIDAYGIDISRRALWQSSLRHCRHHLVSSMIPCFNLYFSFDSYYHYLQTGRNAPNLSLDFTSHRWTLLAQTHPPNSHYQEHG